MKREYVLKLYEDCILGYKLSGSVVISVCLDLNEFIYSCSWKLAVIACLHTVGSPLARCQIAVCLVNMTVGLIFFKFSDRRLGPEAPSVLAYVGKSFITMSDRRLGPESNMYFCLISASRLLHISVRRLGLEANLYVCLISASRLLQMSDRRFP